MDLLVADQEEDKLMLAIKQCLEKDSCLPLLKEEIKLKIQCKRLLSGEQELEVEKKKPKCYMLTEEEILKRNRRKEQNRRSAVRTRARQEEHIKSLEKEVQNLETEQSEIQETIHTLNNELINLGNLLLCHQCKKYTYNFGNHQTLSIVHKER